MVFSVVVSRLRLPAIFALGLAGLRLCFYTKIRRQSFHTAWVKRRNTRKEHMFSAVTPATDMRRPLRYVG